MTREKKNGNDAWTIREHGPIVRLAENLWWVDGALPGMSLRRVMVVAKRADGKLVIHSGIAMREESMKELESFGEPAFLVVPNRGHRLDAAAYKKRYPALRVFAPRGGKSKIEDVVPVDGVYEDFPADDAVRLQTLRGVKEEEGVMLVRSSDGTTVVLNDIVFDMDRKRDPLGFFFTTLLGSAPGPRVSRLVKLVYVKDRIAVRAELERLADIPDLVRVVVSHEKVTQGAEASRAMLRKAATYLG